MAQSNETIIINTKIDNTDFLKGVEAMKNAAIDSFSTITDALTKITSYGNEVTSSLKAVGDAMAMFDGYASFVRTMIGGFQDAKAAVDIYNVGLVASSMAGQAFTGTLTLGQAAVGLMTGQVTLATAATAAWNAVCTALGGPVGVIITAVAVLGAGIAALCLSMDSEQDEHEKTMEAINNEVQARNDLKAKQSEQLEANLSEITNTQSLNYELKNLVDANGKVKEGYEARAKFIIGELNNALGLNMELTNGEITGNENLGTSIDNLLEKKRAEIILESQLPDYKNAVLNVTSAQAEANRLESEMSQARMEQKALEAELEAEYTEGTLQGSTMMNDARLVELELLRAATAKKEEDYNIQNALVQGYYEDISEYETNATLLASGNAEEYAKVQANVLGSKQTTVQGQIQASLDSIASEQGFIDYLKGTYELEYDESRKRTLQTQIEGSEATILAEQQKIDGLKATIVNKGPEYDAEVKNMALQALTSFKGNTNQFFGASRGNFDNVISGLKSKDPEVKAKAEETAKDMLEELKSKDDEYSKAGVNVLDGVINGVNSKTGDVFSTMSNFGGNMLKSFQDSLVIKSPSRKFAELAKFIPAGIAKGINDNKIIVEDSINALSKNSIDKFKRLDFNTLIKPLETAIANEQLKMQTSVNASIQHEILRNADDIKEQQPLYAKLEGAIQAHLHLNGREVAVELTPLISEELAFSGR